MLQSVHCTYCWTSHHIKPGTFEHWLKAKLTGCGGDKRRYFFTAEDYLKYVRLYETHFDHNWALAQFYGEPEQLNLL